MKVTSRFESNGTITEQYELSENEKSFLLEARYYLGEKVYNENVWKILGRLRWEGIGAAKNLIVKYLNFERNSENSESDGFGF